MSGSNNLAWQDIRWALVRRRVLRVQQRIYKASLDGNTEKVHFLQKKLIHSLDAKLLAVQQVTTLNKGRKTPGVDKVRISSNEQKIKLANSLKLDGTAKAIRRVWIPKPGKTEKRPLGIPTIKDRAKQALAKFALEPQWEAVFEPNSYGFRPARRAQDAIEAIFLNMHHGKPKWVYDADIRKCFDKIDHEALLEKLDTFPVMRTQVKAWLKADIMEGYANSPKEIAPSTEGTPQGGIISPLLANIALHGLENHLKEFVGNLPGLPYPGAARGKDRKRVALGVVRYADDFVLIHVNKTILDACIEKTKKWLTSIGLEISEEKSAVRLGTEGFLFLGFQVIQVNKNGNFKVKIHPSKASRAKILLKIRNVIQLNKSTSAYKLIKNLRPIIIGWANYFKFSECKTDFSSLSSMIFKKLRAWVFRRDTRNGRLKVKERYFPSGKTYIFQGRSYRDNWILNGKGKTKRGIEEVFLPQMTWVASEKKKKNT